MALQWLLNKINKSVVWSLIKPIKLVWERVRLLWQWCESAHEMTLLAACLATYFLTEFIIALCVLFECSWYPHWLYCWNKQPKYWGSWVIFDEWLFFSCGQIIRSLEIALVTWHEFLCYRGFSFGQILNMQSLLKVERLLKY